MRSSSAVFLFSGWNSGGHRLGEIFVCFVVVFVVVFVFVLFCFCFLFLFVFVLFCFVLVFFGGGREGGGSL